MPAPKIASGRNATSVTFYAHSPWVGLGAAIIAAAAVAGIHALACIRFRADQVVVGTGINILFIGLPAVLSGALFLSSGSTPQIPKENLLPVLSRLVPFMPAWRIFTDVSIISLLALIVVLVTGYVLYKTPFGLRLRAVGENPEAADAAGVGVNSMRYVGVILSGALAGIGGAYLSIGQSSLFTRNMAAGRGFIALAALIFGKWRPVQTMLACLLFGFADALTIQLQGVPVSVFLLRTGIFLFTFFILWFIVQFFIKKKLVAAAVSLIFGFVFTVVIAYVATRGIDKVEVPVQFIQMIPYVVTIIVLAGFIGLSRAPKALGTPYQKER